VIALNGATEAMMERSTAQRIGDVERMVTSFRRHLRAENKTEPTITASTCSPLQLANFLRHRGMPVDVASIHSEDVEAFSTICSEMNPPSIPVHPVPVPSTADIATDSSDVPMTRRWFLR